MGSLAHSGGRLALPGPAGRDATSDITSPALLRRFHAALASAAAAPCDVFVLGDSMSEGAEVPDWGDRWQAVLAAFVRARHNPAGIPGGLGYTPATKAPVLYATSGWPWTTATALTSNGTERTYGLQRRGSSLNTTLGGAATLAFTGTSARVYYAALGVGPGVDIAVDGGAPVFVATGSGSGVTIDAQFWDTGPLASGSHTLTITPATSMSAQITGVMVFDGDETAGVRLWDGAKSGATTATFTDPVTTWTDYLPDIDPALVIIALGANDSANGLGIAAYTANLKTLIATFRDAATLPPSIVLATHPSRSYAGDWQAYQSALFDLAMADGDVAVFDGAARFGWGAEAFAAGLKPSVDTVHLTTTGSALWAMALAGFLMP